MVGFGGPHRVPHSSLSIKLRFSLVLASMLWVSAAATSSLLVAFMGFEAVISE
jgi:hypothetical protein